MMRTLVRIAMVGLLALAGCGGGGDDGDQPLPTEYDLTGHWRPTSNMCESDEFSDSELDELEDLLSDSLGSDLVHTGDDLVITSRDEGIEPFTTTVMDNQAAYSIDLEEDPESPIQAIDVEMTATSADTLDVTITYLGADGRIVIVCDQISERQPV